MSDVPTSTTAGAGAGAVTIAGATFRVVNAKADVVVGDGREAPPMTLGEFVSLFGDGDTEAPRGIIGGGKPSMRWVFRTPACNRKARRAARARRRARR